MTQPPLEIILEFARAKGADEPFGYPLSDQEYFLRRGEGEYASGRFPWSAQVRQDLLAFESARADAQAVKRLGHVLHDFLEALGWSQIERATPRGRVDRLEMLLRRHGTACAGPREDDASALQG